MLAAMSSESLCLRSLRQCGSVAMVRSRPVALGPTSHEIQSTTMLQYVTAMTPQLTELLHMKQFNAILTNPNASDRIHDDLFGFLH